MLYGISFIFACNMDKPITQDTGGVDTAPPEESGCSSDYDCGEGFICEATECIAGDRNNSLEEAVSLLWDSSSSETINPAGDVDYFVFNAEGGEYLRLYTVTDNEGDDTVVVLRDPNGKVVTWSDDYPTGSAISTKDSVLFAYLADEGQYSISVEDYGSYFGEEPQGSSFYTYSIYIEEWSRATRESDAIDNPQLGIDMESTNMWDSVGVLIQEEGDSDYFQIIYTSESPLLEIHGQRNLDGSDLIPSVRLYDEQGALVAQKENVGLDGIIKYPFMTSQTYNVEITDVGGQGSEDHWTFLYPISRSVSVPYNQEIEPNLGIEEASSIPLELTENSNNNEYGFGYGIGTLETADEDWFTVENPYDGGTLVVCLNTTLYGSTLSPSIDVYDAQGTLLDSVQSDPSQNPNAAMEGITYDAGNYYIRVYTDEPLEETLHSNWYHFITYAASFNPTSYSCP